MGGRTRSASVNSHTVPGPGPADSSTTCAPPISPVTVDFQSSTGRYARTAPVSGRGSPGLPIPTTRPNRLKRRTRASSWVSPEAKKALSPQLPPGTSMGSEAISGSVENGRRYST
ncbi:hypothetical protein FFZ77_30340 [Streptomyces katsurahamanus]|uniref:Uncharacterized protein n=1 Tax=Streptomyces katsurahamanus TaxID=2577098 RepID=A0ABW9P2A3_9ACTN|nr:hypothetical protein [Streptomyces katsurahamanus]